MIVTVFRTLLKRLPAKFIEYRNYKTFDNNEFLQNFDQKLIKRNSYNDKQQYDIFTSIFRKELDKHAPLKMKKLMQKQVKFMSNELRKAIMDQSRLKNEYLK